MDNQSQVEVSSARRDSPSQWRSRLISQVLRKPLTLIASLIVILFVFIALLGPGLAPFPFDEIQRGESGAAEKFIAPSGQYFFGTDELGRDVYSRILWGAREIMLIPGIASALSVLLGTALGLILGYYGGWLDEIVSRALDSLLAIPALVLALVMLGTIGPSPGGIIAVIVLLYLPIVTRVIRSATLGLRDLAYVEAARLRGESRLYILSREILPGVLPALTVEAALRFSYAIFLTASLGFLGFGVQPPSPDWGRMVKDAQPIFQRAPWALWYPAGAIALLIISVNLMADGLRRILRYEGQV